MQVQLLELLQELGRLHHAWKKDFPNASRKVKVLHRTPPAELEATKSPSPPFDSILYFEDMTRAHDFIIFDTALILALQLLQSVSGPRIVHSILSTMFFYDTGSSIQSIAASICRSAEYLLLDIHHSRGYIIFTFPASIAYMALEKETPEARYLYDMCRLNAGSRGFGFGSDVLDQVTPLSTFIRQYPTTSPMSRATTETLVEENT